MKKVGSCIYCHWTNTADWLPIIDYIKARDQLLCYLMFVDLHLGQYDYIKWDGRSRFTFTWCDDFDGKNEPVVVSQIMIDLSAEIQRRIRELPVSKTNPPIIHGKHLFVDAFYPGFDFDEAAARWHSYQGADWLDKNRMGLLKWWTENAIPRIGK